MKLLLLLAFLPTDSLPPMDTLYASIDRFYTLQAQAELAEFQIGKKGEWLKYLPTVGVSYTVDGHPRPVITFSSSIVYRAKRDKQHRLAKRQSIRAKSLLQAKQRKVVVRQLVERYYFKLEALVLQEALFQIDQQLFAIQEDRYQRLAIAPSTFLQAKRSYLSKQEQLLKKHHELKELFVEILALVP